MTGSAQNKLKCVKMLVFLQRKPICVRKRFSMAKTCFFVLIEHKTDLLLVFIVEYWTLLYVNYFLYINHV